MYEDLKLFVYLQYFIIQFDFLEYLISNLYCYLLNFEIHS